MEGKRKKRVKVSKQPKWIELFTLRGIGRQEVVWAKTGEKIDFRLDELDLQMLKRLYESDFPHLDLTEAGFEYFYPRASKVKTIEMK